MIMALIPKIFLEKYIPLESDDYMKFLEYSFAKQIALTMDRIYQNGLTTTSGGNISVRDNNGDIYISPSGVDKGRLDEQDIMKVSPNGQITGKHKPSVEFPFHQHIYQVRSDISAIVHAHPPGLVALSAARKNPMTHLIGAIKNLIPHTTFAPYALPGSKDLGMNIANEFMKGSNVVLMENHGIVIGANNLQEAFLIMEALEHYVLTEVKALSIKSQFTQFPEFHYKPYTLKHDEEKSMISKDIMDEFIYLVKRAYRLKLISGYYGVFSLRVSEHAFLITPHQMDLNDIDINDLVLVKNGKVPYGKYPNQAWTMHADIYDKNKDINALIQTASIHSMVYTITTHSFDTRIIPEGYIMLKEIRKCHPESYLDIIDISKQKPVTLVQNNFVLVAGRTLFQAFDRLEVLEFGANSLLMASQYEHIFQIHDDEIKLIDNSFNAW